MLAKRWIHWPDPNRDSGAELFPCLGFAPIVCDTHGEGDRWNELRAALKLGEIGYGIVSGGAIKVNPNGCVEAIGDVVNRFIRRRVRVVKVSDVLPV